MPRFKEQRSLFEETALCYVNDLYRFAFYLTGNEADAEDLTQDAYHLAFRAFHQFKPETDAKAWLFRIARNAHIDKMRRKAREPVVTELVETPVPRKNPEDRRQEDFDKWRRLTINDELVFYDLFGDEVNRYLAELAPEFRLALVLCDVEGFSYHEISRVLECPLGTVRSRISRAREHLRDKLYDYAKDLGFAKNSKG